MAGTTYSKFFWQDWAGDAKLRRCSAGAQALWMRCLHLVHTESDRIGHVLIGTHNPTNAELSDLFGPKSFPVSEVEKWRQELIDNGVCDVDRDGVMISRRAVKDARKRAAKSAGGKKSAQVRGGIIGGISTSSNRAAEVPSAINQNPSTTSQVASRAAGLEKDDGKWVAKVSEALGWDITNREPGKVVKFLASWPPMRERGIDLELDLLPVIRERRAAGTVPGDLGSLRYFEKAALERKEARVALADVPRPAAQPPGELTEKQWEYDLQRFLIFGTWRRMLLGEFREAPLPGPSPLEEGCRAPAELLEWARTHWNEQGQLPREFEIRQGKKPIPFWGDNVVALPRKESA